MVDVREPMQEAPKFFTWRYRSLVAGPCKAGGWQVRDSAGLVGGFFRDRSTALKIIVRERWAKNAVLELGSETLDSS